MPLKFNENTKFTPAFLNNFMISSNKRCHFDALLSLFSSLLSPLSSPLIEFYFYGPPSFKFPFKVDRLAKVRKENKVKSCVNKIEAHKSLLN